MLTRRLARRPYERTYSTPETLNPSTLEQQHKPRPQAAQEAVRPHVQQLAALDPIS